jgi:type VI protein secretion system component VasK
LYAPPKSLADRPAVAALLVRHIRGGRVLHKPVFLRGIYFTSAMQVGADLDEAVWPRPPHRGRPSQVFAGAVGVPSSSATFSSKVFRERGLVTCPNTRKTFRDCG